MENDNKKVTFKELKEEKEKEFSELVKDLGAIMVQYDYTTIKNSRIPFEFEDASMLIKKMDIAKNMKDDFEFATSSIKNYGDMTGKLMELDTLKKTMDRLNDKAIEILEVERGIKRINAYLKANEDYLPHTYYHEDKDLYALAHRYLYSFQDYGKFSDLEIQKYRTAIIKQGMINPKIDKEKFEKGVKNGLITADDILYLPKTVIGVSDKEKAHYDMIYNDVMKPFIPEAKLLEDKECSYERFSTKAAGVSFNDKGQDTQKNIEGLSRMEMPVAVDLIRGTMTKGDTTKDTVEIKYKDMHLGWLSQKIVDEITSSYGKDVPLQGRVTEVTGGFDKANGTKASYGLNLDVDVSLAKEETAEEKIKEVVKKETKGTKASNTARRREAPAREQAREE